MSRQPRASSTDKSPAEFIAFLKSTSQVAHKPKQPSLAYTESQLPSPIMAVNKNYKDNDDIRECPIEKICLEQKLKGNRKDEAPQERKSREEDRDFGKAYPEHLKNKDERSVGKKTIERRMSRSLIDMSIYDLLN